MHIKGFSKINRREFRLNGVAAPFQVEVCPDGLAVVWIWGPTVLTPHPEIPGWTILITSREDRDGVMMEAGLVRDGDGEQIAKQLWRGTVPRARFRTPDGYIALVTEITADVLRDARKWVRGL